MCGVRTMKIKYCAKNLKANDAKPVYKSVKNDYPDLKHKKEDCLGRCRTCKHECFAMIGKTTIVTAPTAKKLRKKIKEAIG
ncbi:hypothetical protein D3C84_1096800 [compost metagenome]